MTDSTTIAPYYQSPDGAVTVYAERWETVRDAGLIPVRDVALVHADPPYGNGSDALRSNTTDNRVRANAKGTSRGGAERGKERAWAPFAGNDRPFAPAPLLALDRPLVTWGGNHYASRLPDSTAWIFWDKRDGTTSDACTDGELAWTNLGGALRTFRHAWRGLARASETATPHLHPTQKPVALSRWVFERAKLKRGDLVLVPYMGSGPDLAACVAMGLRCIACEVSEDYCRVAVGARLHAVSTTAKVDAGPLFAERP